MARLIDADALRDWVSIRMQIFNDENDPHHIDRDLLELAMGIVSRFPTVDAEPVRQWISVEDRLPPSQVMVLITGLNHVGGSFGVIKGAHDKKGWFRDDIGQYDCDRGDMITHWMPLPEPPKEDHDAAD